MSNNIKASQALFILLAGIGAFALAIAAGTGHLSPAAKNETRVLSTPVQPLDPAVNVESTESLGEIVIVGSVDSIPSAHALGAALARKRASVSGPAAARRRPQAGMALTVPEGPSIATESALQYNPLRERPEPEGPKLRREPSTVGQPLRPIR